VGAIRAGSSIFTLSSAHVYAPPGVRLLNRQCPVCLSLGNRESNRRLRYDEVRRLSPVPSEVQMRADRRARRGGTALAATWIALRRDLPS